MAATQCIQTCRCGQEDLLQLKASIRMGKEEDLNVLVSMVGDQCFANCDSHHITTIQRALPKREKYSVSNSLMWGKMP